MTICRAQGDFAAQVIEVRAAVVKRNVEQLFDHGQEVVQRTDGPEGHCVRVAGRAASGGQQEGGFDDLERDVLLLVRLRELILSNLAVPESTCGDDTQS